MTSSRWHAHGNVYLVSEDEALTPELVREQAQGTDGIVQITARRTAIVLEIVIWNTDGSTAEMSGNGTRIAGAWLMARTGAGDVSVVVGPRTVSVRAVGDRLYESELGEVQVGQLETVDGIELTTVDVGNPHAVVVGDPDDVTRARPAARDASALSEPHERAGRAHRRAGRGDRARVGARRGGDDRIGLERGRRRGGDARRRRRASCTSRAAISACACRTAGRG